MKGQVEDSPAVEEIWDEWSSPLAKPERQWDDIYLAELPEVTAVPRDRGPPRREETAQGARAQARCVARSVSREVRRAKREGCVQTAVRLHRVAEVRGWKEIPEYEPEIQPDPSPVRFLFSALQALGGGGSLAPRARHEEENIDEAVEERPALPTPASSRVSADLEGSAELTPLPAARVPGSARAARQSAPTSPAAPPPMRLSGQGPLPALSPSAASAVEALGYMAGSRGRAVTDDQVERLASLREFFNGVDRTGQALLGSAVAASVPLRLVAVPAAPQEQGEAARPAEPDSASAPPGTPDTIAPPPPLPTLRTGEFRLPGPSVAPRDPPQQLGMDGC
ncbi:hypothetical protein Emag_006157 [Eimeria magna]